MLGLDPYKTLAIAGVSAIALLGAFFYGLHIGTLKSKVAISHFEANKAQKQATFEKKVADSNVQIVTKYIDRWHTVKEIEYVNVERTKNLVPSQYELSRGWVLTHNASASAAEVDTAAAADATPSGIRDNQALITIETNYTKYHQCTAQLNSVLDAIEAYNVAIDEINKGDKK